MNLLTRDLTPVVAAAREGDQSAWAELVARFQDFAVAVALGQDGDWDGARDVAQEALVLAFTRIDSLQDPAAFPGWFAALVRTACGRRARRRAAAVVEPAVLHGIADPAAGPPDAVLRAEGDALVRAAVDRLPEHERTVVALRYLADLEFAEIASFLGISESAARKRAHSARQRLKELTEMTIDSLSAARPSAGNGFSEELLLFAAIQRRDPVLVRALLQRSPDLVEAEESWTWSQAVAAGTGVAQRGTPLVRAVESGDADVVGALLAAGAVPDGRCHCDAAETPLWVAVVTGQRAIVKRLLAAGADPNLTCFGGSTPLHAAAQRHPQLIPVLIAAGADPELRDHRGRTPTDWCAVERGPASQSHAGEFLATGIRVLDLFAPLFRGSRQYWPPAVRVGQLVLPFAIADALDGVELWWIGFQYGGHYSQASLEHQGRELDVPATIRLIDDRPNDRRTAFAASLTEIAETPAPKVVVCVADPEHRHDLTLALQALAADPRVLTTIVIEPLPDTDGADLDRGARTATNAEIPEGFDCVLAFDADMAAAGNFPAVSAASTTSRYPSDRHAQIVAAARAVLGDPTHAAGDELRRYLTQPLRIGEPFHGTPAQLTDYKEMLGTVSRLLGD